MCDIVIGKIANQFVCRRFASLKTKNLPPTDLKICRGISVDLFNFEN